MTKRQKETDLTESDCHQTKMDKAKRTIEKQQRHVVTTVIDNQLNQGTTMTDNELAAKTNWGGTTMMKDK